MIASVGNEGTGTGESYHTSGPQCFIIYKSQQKTGATWNII